MGSGGGAGGGGGQANPYYSMGTTPDDSPGGIKGFLGSPTGMGLLGGVTGMMNGARPQQQPQGGGAQMSYQAPMMPYIAPPAAMNAPRSDLNFYGG